ncbi:thiol disulfide reductase thioredoxin [Psychromonas marina]|uniref:Thiol disulfide reductase thioredoxin n=1 Tax=Psychromonas marina TaxID=88364 RepID=A0ABQ6DXI9_9GAMM|nr:thioredoxin domain-containing protein [Psychromonas marina]GLS89705.1 thiol disulfide reductase thioredoxin [Psychromonas marina]
MAIYVLVCPSCHVVNKVLENSFLNAPLCSACDTKLLSALPIEADEKLFHHVINHSTLPVMVTFWASWSGRSHEMAEAVSSFAVLFQQDAVFLRINSKQEQVLANTYKLVDIPTFILFKSGVEYHRVQGGIGERELHAWLERYLRVKRKKQPHHHSSV